MHHFAPIDLWPHLLTLIMIFGLDNRQKMKEDMSLRNLGTVALHAAKVPTNVFSSTDSYLHFNARLFYIY